MNQNQVNPQPQREYGSVTFSDDKLRVGYQDVGGQQSVLFEDISSIEVKSHSIVNTQSSYLPMIIGIVLGVGLMWNGSFGIGLVAVIGGWIIGQVMAKQNPIEWDNVVIETRGGKLISYSVDHGKGGEQMELIEDAKRQRAGK